MEEKEIGKSLLGEWLYKYGQHRNYRVLQLGHGLAFYSGMLSEFVEMKLKGVDSASAFWVTNRYCGQRGSAEGDECLWRNTAYGQTIIVEWI